MRFFFDTEFWDTGERIHLISIGIAAEDGREYYAEVEPHQLPRVPSNHWLIPNVLSHLKGGTTTLPRSAIARAVVAFVRKRPEFWAYVADYDWVALSQLYGPLVERPKTWPWTALDTYQLPHFRDFVVEPDTAHNALSEAIALKQSWERWRAEYSSFPLPEFRSPTAEVKE